MNAEASLAPDTIDPEILAVLAAATAAVFGAHRIVSVMLPKQPDSAMQIWSQEGRRDIYSSHHIR